MGVIIHEQFEYSDDIQSKQRIEQEEEYMKYLRNHINNVQKSYRELMLPLLKEDSKLFTKGINRALFSRTELVKAIIAASKDIKVHDASKYTDIEFDPYREHWNPTEVEKTYGEDYWESVNERYKNAWVHHYQNNNHHPEFWYDFEKGVATDMSLDAIIHMICDWESFTIDSSRSSVDWWLNKGLEERKVMSPLTVARVDDILFNLLHDNEIEKRPKESVTPYVVDDVNKRSD
jgi:hypothetical protein